MVKGDWIDQKGVEELAAAVVGQVYKDYIRGRLAWYTFDRREVSKVAADRYEMCVRRRMANRRMVAAKELRMGLHLKILDMSDAELRERCEADVEHDAKVGRSQARQCKRFLTSPRYMIYTSRIDAEALIQHAEELLADWLDGKIKERDLLPSGYGV